MYSSFKNVLDFSEIEHKNRICLDVCSGREIGLDVLQRFLWTPIIPCTLQSDGFAFCGNEKLES